MKVILFGGTGMVGQGVLRECLMDPLVPLFKALFPNAVTTTEIVGKAMLQVVRDGAPKQILESRDINAVMKSGRVARLAGAA